MHFVSNAMLPENEQRRGTPCLGVRVSRFFRALAVLAVLLGSASAIQAQTVITLAWNANTEPDLAGYEVSYGTRSGVYSTIVDVGNVTSKPFTLTSGIVYYFAVKAYNSSRPRQYSPYSTEVSTVSIGLGINRAPTLTQPANQTSAQNQSISLALVGSDPDGNPLTYGATGLPASLTVNATTGLISGTLSYTSAGSYTVTATVSDGALTNSQTFAWTVTDVLKATPVITWGNPATITYGTALSGTQLNATASVPGILVYTPPSGTVLAVNGGQTSSTTVSARSTGGQTLSATFTPTDTAKYTTATKTVTIDVAKATPIVTWRNPGRIVHGTRLGATQLNAIAHVAGTVSGATQSDALPTAPGTYVYTPPAETMLAVGTYTLSVTFTPADSANYSAATGTASLVVLPELTLAVAPATLRFAGTNTSGTLSPMTASQTATVTFSNADASTWSASADQPWVQITNGSGTGNGTFTVGMINPGNLLGTATSASAVVTVTAAGASNSPQTVAVLLTLRQPSANQAPFGAFDTPVNGATGLQGSFAVTGWALDDVGIDRVEIWRDPVAGETTPTYYGPGQPGHGKIFIANPLFITGSRTDVEGLYPNYPFANRAGWGHLLLSQGFWNQGNGSYTLYAFAFDAAGRSTTLGTKTITVSNATATKPFGAIDTPAYGATVSGAFWNFGWAVTPNRTPTCTITNGNVQLGIDSQPLVAVNYGDLRTDISASFSGVSNGSHSGGAYYIDTTTLSNGMHQIGWVVTDSCGRQDGVGSRFFTVLNASGARPGNAAGDVLPVLPVLGEPTGASGRVEGRVDGGDAAARGVSDHAEWVSPLEAPRASAASAEPVSVRHLGGDWQSVAPGADGTRVVEVAQDGRIEVQLPSLASAAYAGSQDVGEIRRALPLGSSLDAKGGIFYWQPGPGFLGKYDLAFGPSSGADVAGDLAVRVRVVVGPAMRAVIDTPQAETVVAQPFTLAGWALDLAAHEGTGVGTVHVWAYPTTGTEPIFVGIAAYGDRRPDVGAMFGATFAGAAYGLTVDSLPPGTYDVVVYPLRAKTNTFEGAQVVRISVK